MPQKPFDLKATVHRLLTPQKTLAPWIFDENQKMLPDVREGLLKIALKIVDETIAPIEGLDVANIYIEGSSCDYFYHNKSDFDMFIEVRNNGCQQISNKQKFLDMFLASQMYFLRKYRFSYNGRFVDTKIRSMRRQLIGTYSILNDSWFVRPNKDIIKGLTEEDLIESYEKKRREILIKKQKIIEKYAGTKLAEALLDLYHQIFFHDLNIKDYYIYKILNYENLFRPIGSESIKAYNRVLCL